jgi:hypothetical protein
MKAWNTPIALDPPPTQAVGLLLNLGPRLKADHALKVAHHGREGMRSGCGTEAVVRVVGVGDPVPEGLVDGVLERLRTGLDGHHVSAKQPHPGHVEGLARGVDGTHVDHALDAEQRAGGRGRHPVLTGTRLGDHPGLAHLPGQQDLTEDVVDLV